MPRDAPHANGVLRETSATSSPDRTLVLAGSDRWSDSWRTRSPRTWLRVLSLLRFSTQALTLLQSGLVHVAGLHLGRGRATASTIAQYGRPCAPPP